MRGQARPGRAAHEKCSRVLELAGASMAGDVEEGLSDPAPFSRRRMRSEGLHAVEGVDCGGLRRVFDRLFGDIDLSRSLYRRRLLGGTAHTAHTTYCTLSLPAHPLVGYASFK